MKQATQVREFPSQPRRTSPEIEPALLKIDEAAQFLSLGRSTLYQLIASGQLPVVRIGRSVRLSREALRHWISLQLPIPEEQNLANRRGP